VQEVQLQLTLAEVNQILDALGEKSYKQVYQLIIKIQQQAENQLQQNDQQATTSQELT
jgi:hypothetical protein